AGAVAGDALARPLAAGAAGRAAADQSGRRHPGRGHRRVVRTPAAGTLARAGQQSAGGRLQGGHAGRRQWPAVAGRPPRLVVADGLAGGAGGAAADSPAALPRTPRAALSARTGRAHRPHYRGLLAQPGFLLWLGVLLT